jgi:guanylate kinase
LAAEGPPSSLPTRWEDLPGRLIVLSGAAGSGKTTIVHRLMAQPGFRVQVSISATTREPRPGEVPDVNYYFRTREEFEADRDRDRFLEWAEVHGHLYGTPVEPVRAALARGTCLILVIDVQGAMNVREQVPNALLIFVHAPSPETLEDRLRARGTDDEATILKRLANARREVALADRYDHQILNDDLDRAVVELAAILTRHHCGG